MTSTSLGNKLSNLLSRLARLLHPMLVNFRICLRSEYSLLRTKMSRPLKVESLELEIRAGGASWDKSDWPPASALLHYIRLAGGQLLDPTVDSCGRLSLNSLCSNC